MKITNILVTGGSGFIGSNFIRFLFEETKFKGKIINCDKLTYAANPSNLADIKKKYGCKKYFFERVDICDYLKIEKIFKKFKIDTVIHFAAESHVDRSIHGPKAFIETNIMGTFNLLDVSRKYWGKRENVRFHHISTDEVFGSLGRTGAFKETTPYDPRSPYSASKASSDHLVRAYYHTYGLPITISNCSNNYGPYQFPEKLLPLIILNALDGKPLPIYGDGKSVRDWLYVKDHCSAIWQIIKKGKIGETYNIGGNSERKNIDVVKKICGILDAECPAGNNPVFKKRKIKKYGELITFVKDRLGHDRRYAINASKIQKELGWKPEHSFKSGLKATVNWYLENDSWVKKIKTAAYSNWLKKNYK